MVYPQFSDWPFTTKAKLFDCDFVYLTNFQKYMTLCDAVNYKAAPSTRQSLTSPSSNSNENGFGYLRFGRIVSAVPKAID